jgi:hypothetical protein
MKNFIFSIKKWFLSSLLVLVILPLASVQAATVEVTWTEPDSYRDVFSAQENRKSFRARTFAALDKHFNKLAAQLPAEQRLKINVLDVDLAGDTRFGGINRIRMVKELYFPRIKFSYQLTNADGGELNRAEVNLKDMGFMSGSRLRYRNDSLGYEKRMLDVWFADTFHPSK